MMFRFIIIGYLTIIINFKYIIKDIINYFRNHLVVMLDIIDNKNYFIKTLSVYAVSF